MTVNLAARVSEILEADRCRLRLLHAVASLQLPDCWIGAGFVRNAVWDHLHGREANQPSGDIDVIWFDPDCCDPSQDRKMQLLLTESEPGYDWSVKNQARMYMRNGDRPYTSSSDATRFWPETATAVAARLVSGRCEISAPLGLDDLFDLAIRPTKRFEIEKRGIYDDRVTSKDWVSHWQNLTFR